MSATTPNRPQPNQPRRAPVAAIGAVPPAGVVHLTVEGGKVTRCGVGVTRVVPFRKFSEHPCPACVIARMEAK